MSRKIAFLLFYGIFALAAVLRFYNLNWDSGSHLHPDERAIILSLLSLHVPSSLEAFFSPTSSWNTHFFAYGSFPFYLLKIISSIVGFIDPKAITYDGVHLVGRFLSAAVDLGTLILVFLLGSKIYNRSVGIFASFFYAVSTLSIQLSHFFAVDTFLTFFTTLLLYLLIRFYEKQSIFLSIAIGCVYGLALATKISSSLMLAAISLTIFIDFLLIFFKRPHHPRHWLPHLPKFLKRIVYEGLIILLFAGITYAITSPYTIIDFTAFQAQTLEQSRMTKDAFTFPYTFQYVGKIPYLYEIKNIFLFGLGPFIGTFCLLGLFFSVHDAIKHKETKRFPQLLILLSFFFLYLLIIGSFAIGFMRYMLPIYPILTVVGGFMSYASLRSIHARSFLVFYLILILFFLGTIIWPLSFFSIYSKTHTRVTATNWIQRHIPPGSTIAVEHWDDALPLSGIEKYQTLTYPLYEPDTQEKWELMNQYLKRTDYIILSSNRLYTPLQKLTDCAVLPAGRCYTRTALYYQSLFNGSLGFEKIAQFTSYPRVPFLGKEIIDDTADESFTVYDHPKVMIFRNNSRSFYSNPEEVLHRFP